MTWDEIAHEFYMYALLIDLRDNYVQNPNGIRKIEEQLARCRGEEK